tara:strand:+ start:216 stop:518 length:303 start_codon:yes stop_codon:yes gene_type:complete
MELIKKIKNKKFIIVNVFLFMYVVLNLLDGERGLVSYYEKIYIKKNLINDENILSSKLTSVEKKNNLLTELIDLDYLEILYRQKFMVGKSKEEFYTRNIK